MNEVRLPQGTIRYREAGSGDPIVFVHGLLMNGELWRDVIPLLAKDFRVIAPDWPLGSQELPLEEPADMSPPALSKLIADFLGALDLQDVTLVGCDTGGALSQLVAVEHPERVARLVLTPCDAYEHFPPAAFKPLAALGSRPGALRAIGALMRSAVARRGPTAYGWLMKRYDDTLTAAWVKPVRTNAVIRRQTARFLGAMDSRHTLAAAARFGDLRLPVLIAWAPEDKFFKLAWAERLAKDIPGARLELIEDSYTFVSVDQPARTAELIAQFVREPVAVA